MQPPLQRNSVPDPLRSKYVEGNGSVLLLFLPALQIPPEGLPAPEVSYILIPLSLQISFLSSMGFFFSFPQNPGSIIPELKQLVHLAARFTSSSAFFVRTKRFCAVQVRRNEKQIGENPCHRLAEADHVTKMAEPGKRLSPERPIISQTPARIAPVVPHALHGKAYDIDKGQRNVNTMLISSI